MHRILATIGELTFESCVSCRYGKPLQDGCRFAHLNGTIVVDLELSAVLCKRFIPRLLSPKHKKRKWRNWNAEQKAEFEDYE
jgi:hypothetical protein